jgi:hypothetical protein
VKARLILYLLLLSVCGTTACGPGGGSSSELAALPPAEVFNWGGQPISVSPPPESWRREKAQSGGLRGVRFIKIGSVGEEIRLAEHYALDERDRCARFSELLRDLDKLDRREFGKTIHQTRLYASPPINDREAYLVELANGQLDRARETFLRDQPVKTRTAVARAFEHAVGIRYSLDEVVDRVIFSPDSYDSFGKVEVQSPVGGELAGEPSVSVDFTLDSRDRKILYSGRQVYVMHNNRLFVMTFLGLPENLPLFDQIVAGTSFPPGQCAH